MAEFAVGDRVAYRIRDYYWLPGVIVKATDVYVRLDQPYVFLSGMKQELFFVPDRVLDVRLRHLDPLEELARIE